MDQHKDVRKNLRERGKWCNLDKKEIGEQGSDGGAYISGGVEEPSTWFGQPGMGVGVLPFRLTWPHLGLDPLPSQGGNSLGTLWIYLKGSRTFLRLSGHS